MDTYHWNVLVTYHWDVAGCFIWVLFEVSWRRTNGTSLLRPLKTLSWRANKTSWRGASETSWRRSTETLLGVSCETYLWRRWNVQREVMMTSSWRLVAGSVVANIYIIQAYYLKMCGYFCNGFIDFMLQGKSLLEYTNVFSPND